jgi:hypothetical protein
MRIIHPASHHRSMLDQPVEQILSSFSASLADLVERAAKFAVAIDARHRIGSSGYLWKPGVIITADHTIRRDEDIPVILPDGTRTTAELAAIPIPTSPSSASKPIQKALT